MFNEQQKKIVFWGGVAIGATAIVLMLSAAVSFFVRGGSDEQKGDQQIPSITVTGEGDAYQVPDVATLDFSVTSEQKTQQDAKTNVDKAMSTLISALSAQGLAKEDVKTLSYDLSPQYDYVQSVCPLSIVGQAQVCPPGKQVLRGYQVTQRIEISMRGKNFDNASQFLDTVVQNGATDVGQLDFKVKDTDKVKGDARTLAIAQAKQKADALATQLGVKLVRITSFSESGDMPYFNARSNIMMTDAAGTAPSPKAALPTGQNQYHSNVTITYEIEGSGKSHTW